MNLIIRNIFILLSLSALLFQCNDPEASSDGHAHEEHGENKDAVELNATQIASAGLQYGNFDTVNISDFVKSNGVLDLPPQNVTAVSAPADGFVRKVSFLIGDRVNKGEVLAVIENPDFADIQKEYIQVLSELEYLRAERERQRILDSAQISARKTYQKTLATFKAAMAKKNALEKQLTFMGFSTKRVAAGNISNSVSIAAPISGYVTKLSVHNGEFIKSEQEMYELADNDHMHLELNVFEQDYHKVKVDQLISFTVPSIGTENYSGKVFLIGKSFDEANKTVKVHGHLTGEHPDFIRGLYVEAKIYTGDQKVLALPEKAVVRDEGESFIFIVVPEDRHQHGKEKQEGGHEHEGEHEDENGDEHVNEGHQDPHKGKNHEDATFFRRIQVATGVKDQGYVEIREAGNIPADAKIVTEGAYYLFSEMKKGGHHHHH